MPEFRTATRLTAPLPDANLGYMGFDRTDGTPSSGGVEIDRMPEFFFKRRVTQAGGMAGTETSTVNRGLADDVRPGLWITFNPWTANAEMRQVTNVDSGTATVTWNRALTKPAAQGTPIMVNNGVRDVTLFGAEPNVDVSVAANAALNDHDTELDPINSRQIAPNGLFFPPGKWLLRNTIRFPDSFGQSEFHSPWFKLWGDHATIYNDNGFTGAFFDTVGDTKFSFLNANHLNFLNETDFSSTAGQTGRVFSNRFFRLELSDCTFSRFESALANDDVNSTLTADNFQSVFINDCRFNQCLHIIKGSKVFDFNYNHSYAQDCRWGIYFPNTAQATMNSGYIGGGATFEGFSRGPITIYGALGLVIDRVYFEKNGVSGNDPDIDLSSGQQCRGCIITGTTHQPTTGQQADPNWFAIKPRNNHSSLIVKGCYMGEFTSKLVDYRGQASSFGEGWEVGPNTSIGSRPTSERVYIDRGKATIVRNGRLNNPTGPTQVMPIGVDMPHIFSFAQGWTNSSAEIKVRSGAMNVSIPDRVQSWELSRTYRNIPASGTLIGDNSVEIRNLNPATPVTNYDMSLQLTSTSGTCTFSGTTVTATAHNLTSGEGIHFTTDGVLPTPLIDDHEYYVNVLTPDTFEVYRQQNQGSVVGSAINFSGGSGTHSWHLDIVDLLVTVASAQATDYWAEVTIEVSKYGA